MLRITVIIPTHNRRDSLLRLLNGLNAQNAAGSVDVIIIADGCTDDTVETLARSTFRFPVQVVEQMPGRGAAAARDLGASRATGDTLLFIDDDIEPFPELLPTHVRLHAQAVELVVIGAPVPVRNASFGFQRIAAWAWWEQQFERMSQPGYRFVYHDFFTGVLSVSTALFRRVGGFDHAFEQCRDDSELGLRLLRTGAAVVFSRDGGGIHHELRNLRQLLHRKLAEGKADVRLARRYPELLPTLRIVDPMPSWTFVHAWLRRISGTAPIVGDLALPVVRAMLSVLETMRARRAWTHLQGAVLYFWYWRGAAQEAGGRAALQDLTQARTDHGPVIAEIDLQHGLSAAMQRLDQLRPDGLRLCVMGQVIEKLGAVPGAEPIRGTHLTALIESELARRIQLLNPIAVGWPMRHSVSVVEPATRIRGARPVPQQLLELDLDGDANEPLQVETDMPLRVLVRRGNAPIAWLRLDSPPPALTRSQLLQLATHQLPSASAAALMRDHIDGAFLSLPLISVVICTRDRPQLLQRCLDSFRALDYPSFEIIVVDNAPTSAATERLVAECTTHQRIRYVREDRPGLDWARNRGIEEAQSDIIAFTDDDVRVDPGWLRGIARAFADPNTVLVTGLVVPAELATEAQVVFEDWCGGMGKGSLPSSFRRDELPFARQLGSHHLGVGANMAFRRDWVIRIGGFDTALDVGTPAHGAGDLDIFERCIMSGDVARYEPTAMVWHYHRRDMRALRRQITDYGRAFGVFLISRWLKHHRAGVSSYAFRIWFGWLIGRAVRHVLRRDPMPLALQACEWWGALQAPWAYYATYKNDRAVRQHSSD
jgi:glycosyltransferase involved in cell wall biosynthesis